MSLQYIYFKTKNNHLYFFQKFKIDKNLDSLKFSLKNLIQLHHSSCHSPQSPRSPKKMALDDIPFCNSTDPSYYGTNMDTEFLKECGDLPSNSRRFGFKFIIFNRLFYI